MTVPIWQVVVVLGICLLAVALCMVITQYAHVKIQNATKMSAEAYQLVAAGKANCEMARKELQRHQEDLQRYLLTVEGILQNGPCLIEISESPRTLPEQGKYVVVLDAGSVPIVASYDGGAYPQHRFITPQGNVIMDVSRYVVIPA